MRWITPMALILLLLAGGVATAQKKSKKKKLNPGELDQIIRKAMSEFPGYRAGDLISHRHIDSMIRGAADSDWQPHLKKAKERVLSDQHFLVQLFATKKGQRFMRKVASYKLIYDRLDRISAVPGGKAMLRDLMKLPDAARYARIKTRREIPDLLGLLPKTRNGKTRTIKDYTRAKDRLYTPDRVRAATIELATK